MLFAFLLAAADAAGGVPAAGGMQMPWLAEVAREYGIFAAMVVFFIAWCYIRERQLNQRVIDSETFIRETLITTLNNNTRVIEQFSASLQSMRGSK